MGMAASQATLLTLTSRLHDVEYKAQNIENQKIQLATQKDELYQNYCDALDKKKIQVAFNNSNGTSTFIDATFDTLCKYDENRCKQYSLKDAKTGKVIVDSETAQAYEEYGNDKYSFAWAMLGMAENAYWQGNGGNEDKCCQFIGAGKNQAAEGGVIGDLWMTEVEEMVYNNHSTDEKLKNAHDNLTEVSNKDGVTNAEKQDALNNFRNVLYSNFGSEIYNYMRLNKSDNKELNCDPSADNADFDTNYAEEFPKDQFNYYTRLYDEIQASGGCQTMDGAASGSEGNEWLNNMVGSGRVLIDYYDTDKKQWTETSVATSTNQNYIQEVQDEADLKKAEATYEHELGVINQKDTKFDRDLSKLETERTSITTEMDSIKKVRDDNIERTFGIFS